MTNIAWIAMMSLLVIGAIVAGIDANQAVFRIHQSNEQKLETLHNKIDALQESVEALLEKPQK
jgi:flagellar capping protein FliD